MRKQAELNFLSKSWMFLKSNLIIQLQTQERNGLHFH